MRKQTISLLLSLVLLLSLFPPVTAAGADSGRAGANVTWTLDRASGVLSFEGAGRMDNIVGDPEEDDPLWWRGGDAIREIRFAEGITSISSLLFSLTRYASAADLQRMRNVRTVTVPASVDRIGGGAFAACTRLDEIVILNAACFIEGIPDTLGVPGRTVVAGHPGSTAERFAEVFGYEFRAVGCAGGSHVFADRTLTPAGCTVDGVLERTCVLCGYQTRQTVPAAHDYAVTGRLERTVYTCTRCGDSYAVGESRRLKLNEHAEFTVPAGACLSVCFTPAQTDCYYINVEQFDAIETYGYAQPYGVYRTADGQPIPLSGGGAVLKAGETCYFCFDQVYDDALRVRARVFAIHSFRDVSDTSTCTEGGLWTRVCSYCGETDVVEVSPRGHEEVQTVVTAPTCTQAGLARYTCAVCGETWTEPLPPAHQFQYDAALPWYQHGVCALCGDELTRGTAEPPALRLGETVQSVFRGNLCAFRFTAGQEDLYRLLTDYPDDGLSGGLYDARGEPIHGSYVVWSYEPFFIGGVLEQGQTCYFVIEREDESLGDFSVTPEILHDYMSELVVPPSCTSEGLETWICAYCGESRTEVLPEAHVWGFDVELPWYRHGVCVLCGRQADFGVRTPPALTLGQPVQPVFDDEGSAFYRFTPEQSDVYRFDFTAPCNDSMELLDADGDSYWDAWGDWADGCIHAMIEAGQTVYLRLYDGDGDGAAPPVTAELEHNYMYVVTREPTCTEAGTSVGMCRFCGDYVTAALPPQHDYEYDLQLPWYWHGVCAVCGESGEGGVKDPSALQAGRTETARITEPGGKAFYRFTAEQDDLYRFTVHGKGADPEVWSAAGGFLNRRFDRRNASLVCFDVALAAGQSCCVGLDFGTSSRIGDVSVRAALLAPAQRTELLPDQRADVRLRSRESAAFLRFTPERDGYYEFCVDAGPGMLPFLQLRDAEGNGLDSYVSGDGSSFRLWLEAGQTVDLAAQTDDENGQSFSVLVRRTDSLFDAVPLVPDRYETVELRPYEDEAWFSFTPKEAGSYEFASFSGEEAFCTLYDSEGRELDFSQSGPFGSDFTLRETLNAGETYYFCVMSAGGRACAIPVVLRRSKRWSRPDYSWSEDGRVTGYCYSMDNSYVSIEQTVDASRVVTKEPTFTDPGEAVWIAVFENEPFHTQTRTVYLPPLGASSLPCDGTDCPGAVFADMPAKGHWAHDAIDWALVNEITRGTSDDRFRPDAGCTRAQAATFLWRAAGKPLPASAGNPFSDLGEGAYYRSAVLWALGEGITNGATAEKFSPDAVCTRAQIVTFLWRFTGSPEPETDAAFADVAPGAYYAKAVAWAQENGVTTGTAAGKFSPDAACTRAQVVAFLHRTME